MAMGYRYDMKISSWCQKGPVGSVDRRIGLQTPHQVDQKASLEAERAIANKDAVPPLEPIPSDITALCLCTSRIEREMKQVYPPANRRVHIPIREVGERPDVRRFTKYVVSPRLASAFPAADPVVMPTL